MLETLAPRPCAARAVRRARGFTLIELMVVIVILAGLITLVGPNVWRALFKSKEDTARIQIRNISDALRQYFLEQRAIPRSLDELTQPEKSSGEPYMKSIPLDPWKQSYNYHPLNATKAEYEISSGGPDQNVGTEDDIVYMSSNDKFKGDE